MYLKHHGFDLSEIYDFTYGQALLYLRHSEKAEAQRNLLNATMLRVAYHGKDKDYSKFVKSLKRN